MEHEQEVVSPSQSEEHSSPIVTQTTAEEIETEFDERARSDEGKVEAVLFISGRFLDVNELSILTEIPPALLTSILHTIAKKHENSALRLVNRNDSWKMDVAPEYHYLINKLATGNAEFTKAEQETLAVIAYKQPIKQSVVIKIRGNKSYDHIRKFRELGLVIAKKAGHTNELRLSEEFYEYFNVSKKEGETLGILGG